MHAVDLADRDGARLVLERPAAQERRQLRHLWLDADYQGAMVRSSVEQCGWAVQIVRRPCRWYWVPPTGEPPPLPTGFRVLPRRWVVERTFAWLGHWRRLSKDSEELPATTEV